MTPDRIILTETPRIGIVVGTFAAVPHVHLGLELLGRNAAGIPVLVHDDASDERGRLAGLAALYGADFLSNPARRGHTCGDLTAFLHGLHWAHERGVELLVKFSRRWIPLGDWVPGLRALAYVSQYATYSGDCPDHGLGFRTECLALHVPSWLAAGAVATLEPKTNEGHEIAEVTMHDLARHVHRSACGHNRLYERIHPRPSGGEGYGYWALMGHGRRVRRADVLWHETHGPEEYHAAAVRVGVQDYTVEQFRDVPTA